MGCASSREEDASDVSISSDDSQVEEDIDKLISDLRETRTKNHRLQNKKLADDRRKRVTETRSKSPSQSISSIGSVGQVSNHSGSPKVKITGNVETDASGSNMGTTNSVLEMSETAFDIEDARRGTCLPPKLKTPGSTMSEDDSADVSRLSRGTAAPGGKRKSDKQGEMAFDLLSSGSDSDEKRKFSIVSCPARYLIKSKGDNAAHWAMQLPPATTICWFLDRPTAVSPQELSEVFQIPGREWIVKDRLGRALLTQFRKPGAATEEWVATLNKTSPEIFYWIGKKGDPLRSSISLMANTLGPDAMQSNGSSNAASTGSPGTSSTDRPGIFSGDMLTRSFSSEEESIPTALLSTYAKTIDELVGDRKDIEKRAKAAKKARKAARKKSRMAAAIEGEEEEENDVANPFSVSSRKEDAPANPITPKDMGMSDHEDERRRSSRMSIASLRRGKEGVSPNLATTKLSRFSSIRQQSQSPTPNNSESVPHVTLMRM